MPTRVSRPPGTRPHGRRPKRLTTCSRCQQPLEPDALAHPYQYLCLACMRATRYGFTDPEQASQQGKKAAAIRAAKLKAFDYLAAGLPVPEPLMQECGHLGIRITEK